MQQFKTINKQNQCHCICKGAISKNVVKSSPQKQEVRMLPRDRATLHVLKDLAVLANTCRALSTLHISTANLQSSQCYGMSIFKSGHVT